MLDNRKIGELPEITGKMVKVSRKRTVCVWILNMCVVVLAVALHSFIVCIPEHHPRGVSRPSASVHRAPAAGGLALEQARRSHPGPG